MQGKSLLTAIFCCIRCILYPNTQICIAAGSKEQSAEIISKIILTLMPRSPLLRNEILEYKNNTSGAYIIFKDGSYIKTVTASDNARHNRANVLICDEFRVVKKHIIDTVLKRFLTSSREAGYLNKPEYAHLKERNKQIYLSSAWFKKHWAWEHVCSYMENMMDDKKSYFVCGLPYQLSIKEGIMMREDVEDEMSEASFNSVSFSIENECLWYGESEDAYFNYEELVYARKNQNAFYLSSLTESLPIASLKILVKQNGEVRIVAVDLAVMVSKKRKNDATSITVLQLLPTKNNQYIRNVVYLENFEGGHSETQAIKIRRIYEDFQCDYIGIDTQGVGNGIFDELVRDLTDPDTGDIYPALTCKNNDEMAAKYKGTATNPAKVIYSIKGTPQFNSQCASLLKDNLKRGKLRLLITEEEADNYLRTLKGYRNLSPEKKTEIMMPYTETTLTITEIINLKYEAVGAQIKISEKGNDRKDRYSSLAYANYIACELERDISKKQKDNIRDKITLRYRKPVIRK